MNTRNAGWGRNFNACITATTAAWTVLSGALTWALPSGAWAATPQRSDFTIDGRSFSMELAEGWTAEPGFLNTPLMLMGPYDGQRRPIVIVVPTTIPMKPSELSHFKDIQPKVRAEHRKWMESRQGAILETFKPETVRTPGATFLASGQRYVTGLVIGAPDIFEQRSFHGHCGGTYFYLTSVIHGTQAHDFASEARAMIESLRCQGRSS